MNKSKIGSAINKIFLALLTLILLFNLYILLQKTLYNRQLPKVFGYAQLVAVSGSMEPVIHVGDFLVTREQKEYRVGEIITYLSGSSLITHRVIAVDGGYLLTQGDANNVADDPVAPGQVQGKVVLRIPGLGRVVMFLRNPLGLAVMVFLGMMFIEGQYALDRNKGAQNE